MSANNDIQKPPAPPPTPTGSHLSLPTTRRARHGAERRSAHATALLTVRVAGLLLSATIVIAGATWLLAAAPTRRWLRFPFRGVPARAGEAVAIFTHNGRVLAGVFGLLLIAQLALRNPDAKWTVQRMLGKLGEALLAGLVAVNVLWVGASVGAYGLRMVRAMLPHGPVELAAYALTLALYLRGRHRILPTRELVTIGVTSVLLVAAAAVLETFITV
jgi:hypothetical protein